MNAALDSLDIGPYRPGEEAAILECLGVTFGFAPELATWRHLYLENPAGPPIIVLARDGAMVIGHVAVLPRRIRAFGEEAVAGHSIDGGTHPAWQRRGIRRALGAEAKRIVRAHGFVATYGVSNEQATPAALKYDGRTYLGSLPIMVRPIQPIVAGVVLAARLLAGLRANRGAGSPWMLETVDCAVAGPIPDGGWLDASFLGARGWKPAGFDERHTRLFQDADRLPPVAIIRDAPELAWRYRTAMASPYWQRDVPDDRGLAATVVIRASQLAGLRLLFVMEWHWRTGAAPAAAALMRDVIALARDQRAHGVAAMATLATPHRRILRRLGFFALPEPLIPKASRMSVRVDRENADVARWTARKSWYLTWGDGLIL